MYTSDLDVFVTDGGTRIVMKPPPPIPELRNLRDTIQRETAETYENMFTTPMQSVVLTAASTAFPPFLSVFTPMSEHSSFSLATAPCFALIRNDGFLAHDGLPQVCTCVDTSWRETWEEPT